MPEAANNVNYNNEALQRSSAVSKPTRLSDVARAAGVSLGTASNVFNRPDLVRAEMREHVRKVAAELGFSGPDPVGRLLMGGKANAIGVLPAGDMSVAFAIGSPYLSSLLFGIAEVCDTKGASLMVLSGAADRKAWAIGHALVDGFVLGNLDEIPMVQARQRQVPFALVDVEAGPGVNSVVVDGRAGARMAAEHLLALGHRRFAIAAVQRAPHEAVWHPPSSTTRSLQGGYPLDQLKLQGYADALEAAGIPIGSVPMVEAYPPMSEAGAKLLLDRAPEATAVLAMADRNAIAILAEARRRGIDVPGQLSVIGFDDVPNAVLAVPPLTTIRQDTVEKGRAATQLLFAGGSPRQLTLPVELIVRGSTGPASGS
jgi:DNA-binding LacI/PurR family transcriptional regulator